jgi:hypothetical protein
LHGRRFSCSELDTQSLGEGDFGAGEDLHLDRDVLTNHILAGLSIQY